MNGIVAVVSGLIAVGMPTFIEQLMEVYGFRGCMAILAALNLHVLVAMIALLPVEWWCQKKYAGKIDVLPSIEEERLFERSQAMVPKKSLWYVQYMDFNYNYRFLYISF